MKKIPAFLLVVVTLFSLVCVPVQAKVGDVIGTAYHTDIVVYINNYAIPSYAVNGQSVVVAEDLRNFGFDVIWNGYARSLRIARNGASEVSPMAVSKAYATGEKYTNILETDIGVWTDGHVFTSYAMNGYTMVPIEELTMFGEINWVAGERALKMWVDGVRIRDEKQPVSKRYYNGTVAPDFGWFTGTVCEIEDYQYNSSYYIYYATSNDVERYINYIQQIGWRLDVSVTDSKGIWYAGYVNPAYRVGIAVSEQRPGLIQIQIGTNMDRWESEVNE